MDKRTKKISAPRLWLRYASIILKSQMQYKTSFLLTAIGQFLSSFSALVAAYFLFDRFGAVKDFSLPQVLLCYSSILMAFSLAECFFRGFDSFRSIISNGEFDRIMIRPRGQILQVLGSRIEFTRIGRFFQASAVFVYAIPNSGVLWTADKVFTLTLMVLGGMIMFTGLFMIYASICFFTIEGLEFMNIFTDGGKEFGSYPISIYGEGILKFFTFVIPLALVQYYPLLFLLGKSDNPIFMFLPLAGVLFVIPSYALWCFGLRHYKSTGS